MNIYINLKRKQPSKYTNTQLHNTDVPTRYKCKTKISKKTSTLIWQYICQKNKKTHRPKAQTPHNTNSKEDMWTESLSVCTANTARTHNAETNLANGACQLLANCEFRNCQSIKFLWFFKTKNSTNQIWDFFLLVNMGECPHCQTAPCS